MKKAILAALVATISTAISTAAHGGAVSNETCRLMIDSGKARFEQAWQEAWRSSHLSAMQDSLYAFADALTYKERQLIRDFAKGEVTKKTFREIMEPKAEAAAISAAKHGKPVTVETTLRIHGREWRLGLVASQDDSGFNDAMEADFGAGPVTRAGADKLIRNEHLRRIAKKLGLPSGAAPRTADEYVRDHLGLPASCFADSHASMNTDSDSAAGPAESYVSSVPQAGRSAAAL